MEMFPISPKFASKDKVESFLVLLSCLVMLRHNLLGLLWSSASKWYCSLGEKKEIQKSHFESWPAGLDKHIWIDNPVALLAPRLH